MQYRPHRYQTEFPIDLHTPAGPQKCKVIDVNNTGARIRGPQNLQRGHKIQFNVLGHQVEAIVCWTSGDRIGIRFRPLINDTQVDTLRYRRDARAGHARGSVGFSFAEMR
ncbi:PilZ domain-containing protein [Yoonia sp. F2084L]|uniref:PilZ domain-containing protein n=1 Tax=Yoonia sp. F2084L TaxID=2926419 RepID=UPI001FF3255F|nr:PilZ domain-containing protein [Yoonia sp. F2084L]MCK0097578.1 PilZ domain-containing protein [Yoonia sp. F2084L]